MGNQLIRKLMEPRDTRVSLPVRVMDEIEEIAREKDTSVGEILRQAIETYLLIEDPLRGEVPKPGERKAEPDRSRLVLLPFRARYEIKELARKKGTSIDEVMRQAVESYLLI